MNTTSIRFMKYEKFVTIPLKRIAAEWTDSSIHVGCV